MIHKVLLQKSPTTGEFIDPNVFAAWYGFEKLGIETGFFTWPELRDDQIELTRDTLIVGGISSGQNSFGTIGIYESSQYGLPKLFDSFFKTSH